MLNDQWAYSGSADEGLASPEICSGVPNPGFEKKKTQLERVAVTLFVYLTRVC